MILDLIKRAQILKYWNYLIFKLHIRNIKIDSQLYL